MPISSEDWMKAIGHISDAEQLKVTVQGSLIGSVFVAVTCMVCSLIFGPVGILVGGIVGSCLAYSKLKGTYKPVSTVLNEITPEQREQLYNDLKEIRSKINTADYVELILLLQGGGGLLLKKQVLDIVLGFFRNKLNLKVN